ncbi:MAG: hypothetical protein ACOYOV_00305 [Bacteroidales bacterium]
MEYKEDEKGAYIEFDNEEEYLRLVEAARNLYKFKSNKPSTIEKYINKYINLALSDYVESLK